MTAVALGVLAFAVYVGTGRIAASVDTLPARYLPAAILETGRFYIDRAPALFASGAKGPDGRTPYSLRHVNGHYVSWYPIGTPLMALPIYAAARALGADLHDEATLATLEKVSASVLVAASVSVLTLALLRLTDSATWAVTLAALYAFGTSSLSVSSQALWQHAGGQLALAIVYYSVTRQDAARAWLWLAGLASGTALVARPTTVVLLIPTLLFVAWRQAGSWWRLGLGAVVPLLFELTYRAAYFGDPLYSQANDIGLGSWQGRWVSGVAGLLVSPGRGLLVYSPMLLLSVVGFAQRDAPGWLRAVAVGSAMTVALYGHWIKWWGGHTVGPRILAELAPGLILGLAPLRGRWYRGAVVTLGVVAIAAHALGAFTASPLQWNIWGSEDRVLRRLWEWKRSPLACGAREVLWGFARAAEACRARF